MQLKLGYECKLYVSSTASTAPTGDSAVLKNVKDVTVTLNRSAVDASTRASGAFKTYLPGMVDSEISFKMNADSDSTDNTLLTAVRNAWLNGTALAIKAELGDGYYFMADFIVTDLSNSQSLDGVVEYDVKVKPTIKSTSFLPTFGTASSSNS